MGGIETDNDNRDSNAKLGAYCWDNSAEDSNRAARRIYNKDIAVHTPETIQAGDNRQMSTACLTKEQSTAHTKEKGQVREYSGSATSKSK